MIFSKFRSKFQDILGILKGQCDEILESKCFMNQVLLRSLFIGASSVKILYILKAFDCFNNICGNGLATICKNLTSLPS
jgi:hypothetical protein